MSTCRTHIVFDPTCFHCNDRASREAAERTAQAAEKTLKITKKMQADQAYALGAPARAEKAARAEARRQESIDWSREQRQKKRADAAATAAARKAQGGGLLPKEKFWIYAGVLLLWVTGVITSYQDGKWGTLAVVLAIGVGVGYLVYKRKIKAKRTPPPAN